MPFLRYSRDKRGYENTYVLHTYRREGRDHPRLLYWFRTPPGVRVGRFPLDERAIKAIEEGYPNLSFNWSEMLKVRPAPPPDQTRRSRGKKGGTKDQPARQQTRSRGRAPEEGGSPPRGKEPLEAPREAASLDDAPLPTTGPRAAHMEPSADEAAGPTDLVAPPADPVDLAGDVGRDADALDIDQPVEELVAEATGEMTDDLDAEEDSRPDEPWQHPVATLMGEEMLARLRARYAEIRVRIAEKNTDPETLESIESRAKALDPDRWKTMEDAVRGIEQFEAEAEAVRKALGRRPPRSRKT